jgi:hypothetical protein
MRWLINDANASEQPLKILQQEVPVFEESQHAQVHADAGNQPCATRTLSFCPAHLPAEPKIHCRRRKEQRREGRIPSAVKDVACDYEQILPRIPGTYTPIGDDDDYKKDNEGKRIEKHYGRAICLFKSHVNCQYILPDLTVVFSFPWQSHAPKLTREIFPGASGTLARPQTVELRLR